MIRTLTIATLLACGMALGGCDAGPKPSTTQTVATNAAVAATHSVQLGEQVIAAQVIPTRLLDASVTRRYGIDREADRALRAAPLGNAAVGQLRDLARAATARTA